MALQAAYRQFLDAPNPSLLADNASLHYITTLTTFNGPAEISKHLANQGRELEKKEEKLLDVIENGNSLAVEVHTTLEFRTGGGAYLPSLDDNFLTDRVVTFPIVCNLSAFDCNVLTLCHRFTLLPSMRTERFNKSDKIGIKVLSSN
jgi:hypothetical protein